MITFLSAEKINTVIRRTSVIISEKAVKFYNDSAQTCTALVSDITSITTTKRQFLHCNADSQTVISRPDVHNTNIQLGFCSRILAVILLKSMCCSTEDLTLMRRSVNLCPCCVLPKCLETDRRNFFITSLEAIFGGSSGKNTGRITHRKASVT
jgi:hypothetical protein